MGHFTDQNTEATISKIDLGVLYNIRTKIGFIKSVLTKAVFLFLNFFLYLRIVFYRVVSFFNLFQPFAVFFISNFDDAMMHKALITF